MELSLAKKYNFSEGQDAGCLFERRALLRVLLQQLSLE